MNSAEEIEGSEDLLTKILLGIPARPLFRFKSVSKRWNSLISARYFSSQWKPSLSGLFVPGPSLGNMNKEMYIYIPLNSGNVSWQDLKAMYILYSLGGLFLCCTKRWDLGYYIFSYYICNHTTKQCTALPDPYPRVERASRILESWYLAYDISRSPHYKVILVRLKPDPSHSFHVRIYSSETKCWAPWGPDFDTTIRISIYSGVLLNNVIHWPSFGSGVSLYYDVNGESFHTFPMPLMSNGKGYTVFNHFGEAKGCLVMIVPTTPHPQYNGHILQAESWYHSYDILELEKDYSSWSMKYRVDLRVIATTVGTPLLNLFCALGQEDDEDSFLVLYAADMVVLYKPKDGTFKKVCDLDEADNLALSHAPLLKKHYKFIENPFAMP